MRSSDHTLTAKGYKQETVNLQQKYVDPDTVAHTQAVEHLRLDAKVSILKVKKGVPIYWRQSHLDYYCWKMWCTNKHDLFLEFLEVVRRTVP